MVFNIFANNRDDHVKNIAFIMNHDGEWSLSPAYDLTFSTGPGGEHSMTVDGEGRVPSIENIRNLGKKSGIKQNDVSLIIDQVRQVVDGWSEYAETVGVSETTMNTINDKIILNRYS